MQNCDEAHTQCAAKVTFFLLEKIWVLRKPMENGARAILL